MNHFLLQVYNWIDLTWHKKILSLIEEWSDHYEMLPLVLPDPNRKLIGPQSGWWPIRVYYSDPACLWYFASNHPDLFPPEHIHQVQKAAAQGEDVQL